MSAASSQRWAGALPRRRLAAGPAAPAATIVALAIVATLLLSGVSLPAMTSYAAFEACFVLLPGCLIYLLLSPTPGGWLRVVAIGWPCGYAVEVGAYAAAAALHARLAIALLPVLALALLAALLASARGRARLHLPRRRPPDADAPTGAARGPGDVAPAGLVLLALTFFALYPLPAHALSVVYDSDNIADISWAAEARHHWPITIPFVAGQPAHYYIATFLHMAAVNQVTGVSLPTVVLRLFPVAMLVVLSLQLSSLSRSLGRSHLLGPAAVALFLVVQDLDLDPTRSGAWAMEVFGTLPRSPTYAFGATFFLGLLMLTQRLLDDRDVRTLLLMGILILGAGTSKTSAVADFLGALSLYWLWRLARGRATRLPLYAAAVTAVCFLAVYRLMLSGGYASNLTVHPLDFMRYTVLAPLFVGGSVLWPSLGGHALGWYALLALALPGVLLCGFAPLLGAAWLLFGRRPVPELASFCIAAFLASLAAYLILGAPGDSEAYFLVYGYVALVPVAALGSVRLWECTPPAARRALPGACAALLVLGLALAATTPALSGAGRNAWYAWYAAAYGALALALLAAILALRRRFAAVALSRAGRLLACCIPMICALGLVKPLASAAPTAWKASLQRRTSLADSPTVQGMTAPLYRGLEWVREHSTPCDVVAVNNHYAEASHSNSYYAYYSAFAERRVFLESWYNTPNGELGGKPYPRRLALNELAVYDGSAAALRRLAADGVAYVLVDKTHGSGAAEPASASRLVFDNSALSVYRLLGPAGAGGRRPGCGAVSGV